MARITHDVERRDQTPDAPLGLIALEISYGDRQHSRHAGRQVWHSYTPKGSPRSLEVLYHFLNDRCSLGKTFRDVLRN